MWCATIWATGMESVDSMGLSWVCQLTKCLRYWGGSAAWKRYVWKNRWRWIDKQKTCCYSVMFLFLVGPHRSAYRFFWNLPGYFFGYLPNSRAKLVENRQKVHWFIQATNGSSVDNVTRLDCWIVCTFFWVVWVYGCQLICSEAWKTWGVLPLLNREWLSCKPKEMVHLQH